MNDAPRILIVEDNALMRARLEQHVRECVPHAHTRTAECLASALAQARAGGWSLVLLDVCLPDGNSLDIVPELRSLLPEARILLATVWPEAYDVERARVLGAADLLSKQELFERFAELMRTHA